MKKLSYVFIYTISFVFLLPASAQPPQASRPSPWSVGILMLTDSQPYRGADENIRVLPSVIYRGERLKVLGPLVQYLVFKNDVLTLNANAAFQFTPYEEDDSAFLRGMDEPDPTLLAGLDARISLGSLLSPGWSMLLTAEGDVLDEHGGFQLTVGGSYSFGSPRGPISGGVGAGVLVQDANWTNYFVGVPLSSATEDRATYDASSSLNPYLAVRGMYVINRNWSLMGIARIEWLDDSWTDSSILSDDTRTVTFLGLNYTF